MMRKQTKDKKNSTECKTEAIEQDAYDKTSEDLLDGEQSDSESNNASDQPGVKQKTNKPFISFSHILNKSVGILRWSCVILKVKSGDCIANVKVLYLSKPKCFLVGAVVLAGLLLGVMLAERGFGEYLQPKKKDNSSLIAKKMQQKSVADTKIRQVEELKKKLSSIQDEISNSKQSNQQLELLGAQMAALTQAVGKVQQSADQARAAAQESISASQSSAKTGKAKTDIIESQISEIHKELSPQNYLSVSNLPFEVVGSGYWGSQLMTTIAMKDVNGGYHYRLIGEGQQFNCRSFAWKIPNCSNWNLKNISNDPATAIFVNTQNPRKRVKAEL